MMAKEEYVTIEEAARRTNYSVGYLQFLIRRRGVKTKPSEVKPATGIRAKLVNVCELPYKASTRERYRNTGKAAGLPREVEGEDGSTYYQISCLRADFKEIYLRRDQIRALAASGKIKAFKVSHHDVWYVEKESLLEYQSRLESQ